MPENMPDPSRSAAAEVSLETGRRRAYGLFSVYRDILIF